MDGLSNAHPANAAIVLEGICKEFKKKGRREHATTLKTELVRMLSRRKRAEVRPVQKTQALQDINLVIPKGCAVGIIGRNGSGKSTLLKVVTGIYRPNKGRLRVDGRVSALLELGAGFHPDFTGRENILINGIILGMTYREAKAATPKIIEFAEIGDFIDEPVRVYSSGMFLRLAFAVATNVNPDILIADEILSVGDEYFSHKSKAKMAEFRAAKKTVVLVTHSLDTVENWCDTAVWIEGGRIAASGNPQEVIRQYRDFIERMEQAPSQSAAP